MANILVIDDDRDVRKLVQVVLAKNNHTSTAAMNGQEGLDATRANKFDLIIVDVMMPDLDGYEVTRRLHSEPRTQDIPILILTARNQAADVESARECGADDYLAKPFNQADLMTKVNALLQLNAARPVSQPPVTPPPASARPVMESFGASTAPTNPSKATGQVIVVLGLRGGVGKTTVAINLAGTLTRLGKRACLVDLSPNGGHVAAQLHLRPARTWADLPNVPEANMVGQTLTRHDSGLFVLAAPAQPIRRGLFSETFQATLNVLRGFFSDIIIDAAPSLDNATCAALSAARHVLIVLSPETLAIQTAAGTLQSLMQFQITTANIHMVLNHNQPDDALPPAAAEKALGQPPHLTLPYDRAQAAALMQGTPLIFTLPQAPLAATIAAYATKL